jgi:lantibiotic modifying enzyme
MLQYGIGIEHVTLGDIFRKLEEIEKDLDIEDYSVSQNTLDNVSFFCSNMFWLTE